MEDPGPVPGVTHFDDESYARIVEQILSAVPTGDPLRIFAYGSLIWKPEYTLDAAFQGTAFGWHRAFCMRLERFRGTCDEPGLMMGLERGGSCRGMVHEVRADDHQTCVDLLVRREMITTPCTYTPRWLRVKTEAGEVAALAFVIDRSGWSYEGGLSPYDVAERLACAVGHIGSNAEYLMNTVRHLEAIGVRDRNLSELDRLVAEMITERHVR